MQNTLTGTTQVLTDTPSMESKTADVSGKGFDLPPLLAEFNLIKQENWNRNEEYYLCRQAVKGNFRWPRTWPSHIPKVNHNMCKPIVERMSTYLMGRGFSWNVDRPNTIEQRDAAERAEKILKKILELSQADIQFTEGAKTGSKLGRTVFKVYKKGKKGREHACFSYCQPDYFYGIPLGAENPGEFSMVYYSYPIDIAEAKRRYGDRDFKSEADLAEADRYVALRESQQLHTNALRNRRIPVVEAWTQESYALIVGGRPIYNGANPYKWSDTEEGFIPFVAIENIRNDEEGFGESDIGQARILNERLNYMFSRREHLAGRWLTPTLVWEGAPQNFAEILTASLEGGGAIPTRLGSRLYFLAYDRDNPQVLQQMSDMAKAILDVSGMNAAAFEGSIMGSQVTGPIGSMQLQPMLSTIEKKQGEWAVGIRKLFAMLLQIQEDIGDSEVLGEAVINSTTKSKVASPALQGEELAEFNEDGQLIDLSGKDIRGLRSVTISWPGVLPKDDMQQARLELEKMQAGIQSVYTTMEKLGEEFPDDEIARIRMENQDPSLKGEKVAEQMRAQAPLMRQQMQGDQQAQAQQMQMMMQMAQMQQQAQAQGGGEPPAQGEDFPYPGKQESEIGARLRALGTSLNEEGDHPVFESGGGY